MENSNNKEAQDSTQGSTGKWCRYCKVTLPATADYPYECDVCRALSEWFYEDIDQIEHTYRRLTDAF